MGCSPSRSSIVTGAGGTKPSTSNRALQRPGRKPRNSTLPSVRGGVAGLRQAVGPPGPTGLKSTRYASGASPASGTKTTVKEHGPVSAASSFSTRVWGVAGDSPSAVVTRRAEAVPVLAPGAAEVRIALGADAGACRAPGPSRDGGTAALRRSPTSIFRSPPRRTTRITAEPMVSATARRIVRCSVTRMSLMVTTGGRTANTTASRRLTES